MPDPQPRGSAIGRRPRSFGHSEAICTPYEVGNRTLGRQPEAR
ncbi:hypothetical protein [Streptomyces sp. JNUCC 63]